MTSICLGSSDEDVDCDCALFVPRKSKKSRCKQCGHSKTSHSGSTTPQSNEHTTMAATQHDHNKYVDRLARSLKSSAVLEKARRETLQGYRPVPPASVCLCGSTLLFTNLRFSAQHDVPSTKGKAKSRVVSTRVATQNAAKDSIKFGRIVFFPCGDQVRISPGVFNPQFISDSAPVRIFFDFNFRASIPQH